MCAGWILAPAVATRPSPPSLCHPSGGLLVHPQPHPTPLSDHGDGGHPDVSMRGEHAKCHAFFGWRPRSKKKSSSPPPSGVHCSPTPDDSGELTACGRV